jgi:TPR repeat/Glycosyltransferase family 9 (heptosyltransferase)/Tetratricopeptide repeat
LQNKEQLDEAIIAYRQAIALKPEYPEAYSNLGNALRDSGRLDEAIISYRQAIALKPNYAEAHGNLATALLLWGDFKSDFKEYEWRWKCANFLSPFRNFAQPRWDGGALETRTLLLYTEQGFGDALQFIRFLPLAAQHGGRIIVLCQTELQRLFRTMPVRCQVIAQNDPVPDFDLHCPVLSLPFIFGTTLGNVPNIVPYLYADGQDAKKWQQRLDDHLPNMKMGKVGLVWAGNLKPNRNRSMELQCLAPLGQVPGVRFFSLQKGEASAQAKIPPAGMELVDWTDQLTDFADTAAMIADLDLIITIDTAVAHLAGAMGKPVWTMLPFNPDWRWLLEREDSPWYPTMRLFRQSTRGDWDSVIKQVTDALSVWIKSR